MTDEELEAFCATLPNLRGLSEVQYATFFHSMYTHKDQWWMSSLFRLIANLWSSARVYEGSPLSSYLYDRIPDYYQKDFKVPTASLPLTFEKIPTEYNEDNRMQHTWVVGPPGSGKTTLLENLICHDLEKVKRGSASVIVMDSQGEHELLGRIQKWGILDDMETIVLDTSTPFNIFAIAHNRAKTERDREILYNNAITLINYVFSSSSGGSGALTKKQSTLFNYCVQLLLVTPNATILHFLALLVPKGLEPFKPYVKHLEPSAQLFFNTQFDDPKQYADTKKEIHWRIDSVIQIKAFARMFTTPKSFDLFSALSKPKLILVNTDKALLQDEGTETFGRFFIALLLSASQQRAILSPNQRLPVYCYIDEAADYIATDEKIATIIAQARKMNIAMTFAHQYESQIKSPTVLSALRHTATHFIATTNHSFSHSSGHDDPSEIVSPPKDRPQRIPKVSTPPEQPATTVATFIHEGEIIPPPPKGLHYSPPDDDDISQG